MQILEIQVITDWLVCGWSSVWVFPMKQKSQASLDEATILEIKAIAIPIKFDKFW